MSEHPDGHSPNGASVRYVDVAKSYGTVRALISTTLEVASGEFFSIIGPSGSGKTTLLGVTAGFIPPSSGQILINGEDVVSIAPFKRNIGMVFQQYSLFPHMSVAENIGFPLRMRRATKAEIAAQVERMLDMVRLSGMADRKPTQLSGGQQQRVALARAAIYDPDLLLMDEPLGALDKNLREEMQDEIKQFQSALGTTVIYVTHDQSEAAAMSHRIAIMNHGRVEQIGMPRELYDNPRNRFVASFLGEANLFEVAETSRDQAGGLAVRTPEGHTFRLAQSEAPARRVVVCVRPEQIALSTEAPVEAGNVLQGTVSDVTYAAGSVRSRIELADGTVLTHRVPSERHRSGIEVGQKIFASWSLEDTQLIADEDD